MSDYRIERDSMGEVRVPSSALYGAQTQRAVENFTIAGPAFPRQFLRALGLIKLSSAAANAKLGLLDSARAQGIASAAREVALGMHDSQFPLVIYQTGSGTSTNMNANEVIASIANRAVADNLKIHPNDHVNMGQSSNDVIPTAIYVSAALGVKELLLPALAHLHAVLAKRAAQSAGIVKTGRTHLMDAMPLRASQEIGGWAWQVRDAIARTEAALPRLQRLALGGTAVGTGINAHAQFAATAIEHLSDETDIPFEEASDHFAAQGGMDAACELHGTLKATATALMKIADDLRWLNSGPIAGLGEIALPALQPGSSIMPGKVNPVICEAMMMACAQVMGNDVTVGIANSRGNFQLNVMLPIIAHNVNESIELLASACRNFADRAVAGYTINTQRIASLIDKNPILVTALNPVLGYDKAAQIAKRAYAEGRALKDVAAEMTDLSREELERILNPEGMV